MKITFVMASGFSLAGGDRAIAIYAKRLQERGHEVFIISRPKGRTTLRQQVQSLLKGQGLISVVKNEPSHFDGLDVPCRVIDRWRPVTDADVPDADVVIATWWETAEWVASMSEAKGVKVYFLQHHEVFDYLPKERVAATWLLPMHKIVVSQWLVDLAQTQYGDSNVSLVPYSVDPQQFYAPPRGKQSIPTVGMMYSTAYWKGCDVSFKAFSLAAQKVPNIRMVAFGSTSPSPELPLPLGTKYIEQPAQNIMKDIYAGFDVWLCGSWSEGYHLPPLEAMACRCPVVSTQIGGPMDIIENGVNGYVVPTGDSTALASQLVNVLTLSDAEWRTMSDAAYSTVTQYTWDDATKLFEAGLYTAIECWKSSNFLISDTPKHVSS